MNPLPVTIWVSVIVTLALPSTGRAEGAPSPSQLLERAARIMNIRSEGMPAFRLSGHLKLTQLNAKEFIGSYSLRWQSRSHWREEIEVGNYRRVRVGEEAKFWQSRSIDFELQRIHEFDQVLDFVSLLRPSRWKSLGKMRERIKDGARMACVELRNAKNVPSTLCFDNSTGGALIRTELGGWHLPGGITRTEYAEFLPWSSKLFPHRLRAFSGKQIVLELRVDTFVDNPNPDPSLFVAPPGSEEWATCEQPQEPELIKRIRPRFVPLAKLGVASATVAYYATIEVDGSTSHVHITTPSGVPEFDRVVEEAVKQEVFKPKRCGDVPVRDEIFASASFEVR